MSKSSINRRSFLKKGLVATAGSAFLPQIIPASTMGNSGFVVPMDRLVMGAIGVGGMGTANMNRFLKKKEVQFVAVCDVATAHNSISIALIGEIAILTGQKLDWDYPKEPFTNSYFANRLLSRPYREPWEIPEF